MYIFIILVSLPVQIQDFYGSIFNFKNLLEDTEILSFPESVSMTVDSLLKVQNYTFKESPYLICAHCGSVTISVTFLHQQIFFFFFLIKLSYMLLTLLDCMQ